MVSGLSPGLPDLGMDKPRRKDNNCEKREREASSHLRIILHFGTNAVAAAAYFADRSYGPGVHLPQGKHHLTPFSVRDFIRRIPACGWEIGQGASVICYAITPSAIVHQAYDPLPPTASLAARRTSSAW